MNFKCTFCSKYFNESTDIVKHLKKSHHIVENDERIKCLVNYKNGNACTKTYLTFSALKTHMKSCIILRNETEAVCESLETISIVEIPRNQNETSHPDIENVNDNFLFEFKCC